MRTPIDFHNRLRFGRDLKVAVLADGEPRALAALVRQQVASLDRELAIQSIESMDEQVSNVVAPQRFSTWFVGAFAVLALVLACVGLYGLLAFTIAQRQREVAVRMALGAERGTVIRMVVGQGMRLVVAGLAAGFVVSLVLARGLASWLYQTSQYDPITFATVPVVLALARSWPARCRHGARHGSTLLRHSGRNRPHVSAAPAIIIGRTYVFRYEERDRHRDARRVRHGCRAMVRRPAPG